MILCYSIYQAHSITYNNRYKHTTHKFRKMHGSSTTKLIRLNSHQMSILPRTKSPVSDCTKLTPNLLHKSSWGGTNSPIHRLIALIPIDCRPFAPGTSHTSGTEMRKYIRIMLSKQRQITEVSS